MSDLFCLFFLVMINVLVMKINGGVLIHSAGNNKNVCLFFEQSQISALELL